MNASVKQVSVEDAYEDILQRTLSHISCDLARPPAALIRDLGVLPRGIDRPGREVHKVVWRKPEGSLARVAKPRALPGRYPRRSEPRGGAALSLEYQTRLGNFPPPSEGLSGASVSRMATPVTCPTISASVP